MTKNEVRSEIEACDRRRGYLCYNGSLEYEKDSVFSLKPSDVCSDTAFETVYKSRKNNPDKGIWFNVNSHWLIPLIALGIFILTGFIAFLFYTFENMLGFIITIIIGLILLGITSTILNALFGGNIGSAVVGGYIIAKEYKNYKKAQCLGNIDRYANAFIGSEKKIINPRNNLVNKSNMKDYIGMKDNFVTLNEYDLLYFKDGNRWNKDWNYVNDVKFDQQEQDLLLKKISEIEREGGRAEGAIATGVTRSAGRSNVGGIIAGILIGSAIKSAKK